MVYRPNIDDRLCFVLMPFRDPFNDYYQKIIRPAASDAGLETLRADDIFGTGVIITDIWEQIWRACVVIADVTDKNPNVNYELGLCHSLGVPTVLLTMRMEDVPFDYRHRRCITYETSEVGWDQKLKDALTKTLKIVLEDTDRDGDLEWPYDTQRVAIAAGSPLISIENPRDLFVHGTQYVVGRIGKALGPAGAQFSVSVGNRESMPYKQGYSIVHGMRATNPLEERGVRQMQLVADEISNLAGDGTKTAIIVAQALIEAGHEALKEGYLLHDLLSGMKKAVDYGLQQLRSSARPVRGNQVPQVASTAAMDATIGNLISEAMNRIGKDGVLSIENSGSTETSLEVVEGMQLDRGFLSDQFITNHETNEVVLDNPYILVHERRISSTTELLPLLEQIAETKEPLLIIAEDVEGEALSTLIVNHLRGALKVAAIKAPGTSDRRKATLDDIAILTGAKLISPYLGISLGNVNLDDLGRARSIIIDRNATTIVEGAGRQPEIEGRVRSIRVQIEQAESPYERERLYERLARLVGGLAVIKIGSMSEIELIDKRYRTETAMHAARAAIEEGWVPGGGVTLLQMSIALKRQTVILNGERAGVLAVAKALEQPIQHLIENAQVSSTNALHEIRERDLPTMGFNVDGRKVEDLVNAGILDPCKTLRIVLELAFTHANSVLQTADWDLSMPIRTE